MMPLHYVRRCQLRSRWIIRSEQLSGKPSAAGGNTTPARVFCQAVPCPNAFKVDMRATVESGVVYQPLAPIRAQTTAAHPCRRDEFAQLSRRQKGGQNAPRRAPKPLYRAACVTLRNFKSWQHPEVFPGGPPPQY